jgi:hypothetical protein
LLLFAGQCGDDCPANASIVTNIDECTYCTTVVKNCINCSDSG